MIHIHWFICHQLYTILTTNSVIKYHVLSSVQTRNVQLCWRGGAFKVLCSVWFPASDAMYKRSAIIWDFTQCRVVIPYRRFGPTYPTYNRGSASSGNSITTCRNLSVEMGLTGCPETSVRNYHSTPREIPHKSGFQVLCSFC